MRKFWILSGSILAAMLILFFVLQALDLRILSEEGEFLREQDRWVAGLAGFGLLVADVVIPVPASMVMVANGVLFGAFWGSFLSWLGGMGASAFGYGLGQVGRERAQKWLGSEGNRVRRFFRQHGILAVIASRPIPLLAEAVSIVAGMSDMPKSHYFLGCSIGLLPAATLYGCMGAWSLSMASGWLAFGMVLLLAGVTWLIGQIFFRSSTELTSSTVSATEKH